MTPEELMKPRYKVIADYPGSPFVIGVVVNDPEFYERRDQDLKKWPAIFKPLQWWEERKGRERPNYLWFMHKEVFEVEKYFDEDVKLKDPIAKKRFPNATVPLSYCKPATEQEYLKNKS